MNGWCGEVLHVNLSNGAHERRPLGPDDCATWIGGKGLAGHYLRPHIRTSWDAPEAPLIFMTGPLVGTRSPTSGRMCVMARSPLTGTVGDCSVGGRLGTAFKKAGIDGLVITGCSDRLCGIEISDDSVEIVDATSLAGTTTDRLHATLKGKGSVAGIGPAAENGVRFSSIITDGSYAAGRNGLGLVFAAKDLKYMTVRGTGRMAVHDADALKRAREDIFRLIAASPILLGEHGIANYGTGAVYDLTSSRRIMPTANFRRTYFEGGPNAVAFKRKYAPKRAGCQGCHILCKKVAADGTHLPEFETMSHFSALLENTDMDVITRANALCNELGMDTISAAATLSCHAEIRGGPLRGDEVLALIEDMGLGRGIGRELGAGSQAYAEAQGLPNLSISVKGLELPAYDPRGAYGMALAYATSTRGGCHLRAYPISHEILRKPVATDRFSFAGKARIIKIAEDLNAVVDSLTACKFVFFAASLEEYSKAFTAVTGVETTAQDLLAVGERIIYHERMMNALNGFTAADDDLPPRFFEEAGSSGNAIDIRPINRREFLEARSKYYTVRGLDPDGMPTRAEAERLGLAWEAP